MTANVDSVFCVRKASWHQLENLIMEWPGSVEEAVELAFPRRDGQPGSWEPIAEPVFVRHISVNDEGEPVEMYVPLEGFKAIVRDDVTLSDTTTGAAALSVPRETYEIIGNRTLYEIVQAILGSDKAIKFDTGGSLGNGEQVFCTVLLDEPVTIGGDDSPVFPYFNANTGHDGATACRVGYHFVRQVCQNTVSATNMRWDSGEVPSFTFKHTSGVMDRIEEAKAAITQGREAFAAFVDFSNELAKYPCSDEQWSEFLERFVPMPAADVITERQRKNVIEARSQLSSIYETSITCEAIHGTGYGAMQAGVEYLDHYRKARSDESRLRRTLMSDDGLKGSMLSLVADVVGMPYKQDAMA